MVSREPVPSPAPAGEGSQDKAMTVRSVLLNRDSPDIESRLKRRRNRTQQVRFKDLVEGGVEPPAAPSPNTPRASPPPRDAPEPAAAPLRASPSRARAQPGSLTLPMPRRPCMSTAIQTSPGLHKPLAASQPRSKSICDVAGAAVLPAGARCPGGSVPPPQEPRSLPYSGAPVQGTAGCSTARCAPEACPLPTACVRPRRSPGGSRGTTPRPASVPCSQPRPAEPRALGRSDSEWSLPRGHLQTLEQPQPHGHPQPLPHGQPQSLGHPQPVPIQHPQPLPHGQPQPLPHGHPQHLPHGQPQSLGHPQPLPIGHPQPLEHPQPQPHGQPQPLGYPRPLPQGHSQPQPCHPSTIPATGIPGLQQPAQGTPPTPQHQLRGSPWGGPCCSSADPLPPAQGWPRSAAAALPRPEPRGTRSEPGHGPAAPQGHGAPLGTQPPGRAPELPRGCLTPQQSETLRHVQDLLQLVVVTKGPPAGDEEARTAQGAGPGERGDLRSQLQSLEGVLETSQQTIRVLLDVIQDLEKKEAQRDGRHSYRTGQDIANCGTCRDCACIIYSVEHDFRQQEGRFQRVLSHMDGDVAPGSPEAVVGTTVPPRQESSPGLRLPMKMDPKKHRRKCFWFL
ncbi:uncharacterized protein LOC136005674 [Lathamus discolor]|uniref:uncharacterized protein LOC136005674 n=1 Tax=Lathamus discolor TaxID=678569 RepID=UPI0032B88140